MSWVADRLPTRPAPVGGDFQRRDIRAAQSPPRCEIDAGGLIIRESRATPLRTRIIGYHAVKQTLETTPSAIKGRARLVLLALAHHANDTDLTAFPSIPLLAWETGMTPRSVHRALADLEEAGAIVKITRRGRKHSNLYELQVLTRPEPHPTRERGKMKFYQARLDLKRKLSRENREKQAKRDKVVPFSQNGKHDRVVTQNMTGLSPLNVTGLSPEYPEEQSGNNGALSLKEGIEKYVTHKQAPNSDTDGEKVDKSLTGN